MGGWARFWGTNAVVQMTFFPAPIAASARRMRDVKRRTGGSAHRHRRSRTASPAVIDRADGIGNGLIGDGAEPDETGPPQTYIAKILLGDQVNDIVTSPNNSVAYAALSNSIAVISSLHGVSCIIPVNVLLGNCRSRLTTASSTGNGYING